MSTTDTVVVLIVGIILAGGYCLAGPWGALWSLLVFAVGVVTATLVIAGT